MILTKLGTLAELLLFYSLVVVRSAGYIIKLTTTILCKYLTHTHLAGTGRWVEKNELTKL